MNYSMETLSHEFFGEEKECSSLWKEEQGWINTAVASSV
jgi:hypothetical protein